MEAANVVKTIQNGDCLYIQVESRSRDFKTFVKKNRSFFGFNSYLLLRSNHNNFHVSSKALIELNAAQLATDFLDT